MTIISFELLPNECHKVSTFVIEKDDQNSTTASLSLVSVHVLAFLLFGDKNEMSGEYFFVCTSFLKVRWCRFYFACISNTTACGIS